jgi:uncharacterized membrane protein
MEEQQYHQNQQSDLFNEMGVDPMARQYIRSMASWAMIIVVTAVLGYIVSVIDLFRAKPAQINSAEGFGFEMTQSSDSADYFGTFFSIAIGLLINFFLYRFASQSRAAVDQLDQQKLNNGFGNLKAYFMACSIILIIVFVMLLLGGLLIGIRAISPQG